MDWDDLKYVLAVARGGTYSAAATALQVNQTTITRRIQQASSGLAIPLFDRVDGRLVPTEACRTILVHAEHMEREVAQALHTAGDLQLAPRGTVRVATVEALITDILGPALTAFNDTYPDIRLELIAGHDNLNLSRREADIALRLNRPQGGTAVTRKLCELGFALYEARAGAREQWLGYDESLDHLPEAQWLRRQMNDQPPVLRSNSVNLLQKATGQGLGRAMLACVRADQDPLLTRVEAGKPPQVTREVWLLIHETARRNRAVRAVVDWIDETFTSRKEEISG
ncbi:LysR family transcriptional regulator [Aestuariispira ectoiniformans]|uniref:LysR family transcriptional regulator n=1 Tax=Aestuariispira ectoiniformans TaxID=2775080 RepID=UPI00223A8CA6|nr:LysR family transcriptional regulator [Aestuariispira ectoiniformans]